MVTYRSAVQRVLTNESMIEITRLRNSVEHLRTSNQELDTFLRDPENADDTEGLEDVIKENDQVM